jgi:hypothetical protein
MTGDPAMDVAKGLLANRACDGINGIYPDPHQSRKKYFI